MDKFTTINNYINSFQDLDSTEHTFFSFFSLCFSLLQNTVGGMAIDIILSCTHKLLQNYHFAFKIYHFLVKDENMFSRSYWLFYLQFQKFLLQIFKNIKITNPEK